MSNDGKTSNPATERLRDLKIHVDDAIGLLRAQSDMLRKRGVQLPSGVLTGLNQIRQRIDSLTRSLSDSQQELRRLRALAETTALINSAQKTDEVLNQVMDTVIALTGAERGYIVLKNPDTGALEFRIARGMEQSTLDNSSGMIVSKTIVNTVADTGEAILTDNASQDERYQSQESIVGFQLRSILAVPLTVRDRVIGVVYCDNRFMSGLFKQSELNVLKAFTAQAAVAIENARLFEATRMRLEEVTELRDRMANLFNSVASGVLTVDGADRVLVSNATMHTIAGSADMIGQTLLDVLPPMPQPFYDTIAAVRSTGEQRTLDLEWETNGQTRYWTMIASPLRGAGGTQGVAMVIDDITEQKQSESQILTAQAYLPAALATSMKTLDLSAIPSEEREITALFADVRGFTGFSEDLEPEDLMTVINKYLSLASDAINLFEGIVDKYMGDAVTGMWNTQLNPQADHANRAIQAAMQLVLDLHAQHEVLAENERLFFGIGIHSGQAVLGNVGSADRKEFSAFGEATEISKYLQEQAGPGEIIISGQTYEMVQDYWECESLTELVRPKAAYAHIDCLRVVRRKKGAASSFVDDELLALLADDDES